MAVWLKLDTRLGFAKVQLEGLSDVYDLCSTACKTLLLGIGGDCLEVTLVAPPGPRPTPDALAAVFSTRPPLYNETSLSDANVVAGSWLVARITNGEGALAAANAAAVQDRLARLETEALLDQALKDLKAVQVKAKLRDEEYNKQSFLAWMLSISSSASGDTASHADEKRRGAPFPTFAPLASVLAGLPEPAFPATRLAWKTFATAYHWAPPRNPALDENRDVHPTIRSLLEAVVPTKSLRLWCNEVAGDDIVHAQIKPDFTLTHARDAMASTIGSLLMVEVKLPGEILDACSQARAYLRRSIHKRCVEADERGEAMDGIFAFGLATDGQRIVAIKMSSGSPPLGGSFFGATPCPVVQSPALPLLEWDFVSPPPRQVWIGRGPPPGFSLLHRLCAAPPTSLVAETILSRLTVQLRVNTTQSEGAECGGGGGGGGSGGSGGSSRSNSLAGSVLSVQEGSPPSVVTTLILRERLGCGGSSDAYECISEVHLGESEGVVVSAGVPVVAKVSRVSTALVQACFERERRALLLLRGAALGLFPSLLASGRRMEFGRGEWPVLVLWPRGQSLSSWVGQCVAAEGGEGGGGGGGGGGEDEGEGIGRRRGGKSRAQAVRQACASAMALRVLEALEVAHAASLVHCDVRPSNIVWVPPQSSSSGSGKGSIGGGAMLLDWGISRATRDEAKDCGVAAYAHRLVFEQTTYSARPKQDVIGLLLTWLCVAHTVHCDAPWSVTGTQEAMFVAREQWLRKHSKGDGAVARVIAALRCVEENHWSGKGGKEMYDIVRKALQVQ